MSFGDRGRGGGGRGRGKGRGLGPSGFCQCPKCGRKESHRPGVPCNQTICPACNIPMMRQAINQNFSRIMQNSIQNPSVNQLTSSYMQNNIQQISPPIVDTNKCNGCSECVNQCPNGAISIINDKAVINYIKCRNCRICENICPVNAIG